MKALRSFETSGTTCPTTQRHIPQDLNLQILVDIEEVNLLTSSATMNFSRNFLKRWFSLSQLRIFYGWNWGLQSDQFVIIGLQSGHSPVHRVSWYEQTTYRHVGSVLHDAGPPTASSGPGEKKYRPPSKGGPAKSLYTKLLNRKDSVAGGLGLALKGLICAINR